MSDRTSAGIFAEVFSYLAIGPIDAGTLKFAARMWESSRQYDFDPYQMGCDEALLKLGLAKRGVRPEYPSDGEVVLYRRGDEWR